MRARFEALLARYGQDVLLARRAGGGEVSARAFVQPVLRQREDLPLTPTPLGAASGQRWLYIGSGGQPLDMGDRVDCCGLRLIVQETCAVYWQDEPLYWRAILRPRKEDAP